MVYSQVEQRTQSRNSICEHPFSPPRSLTAYADEHPFAPRRSLTAYASELEHEQKFRVILPCMELQEVQTQRTIAAIFLGQRSRMESFIFDHVVRDSSTLLVLWVLWWVGMLLGLLSLMDVVMKAWNISLLAWYCSLAPILMLPLPLAVWLALCTDLWIQVSLQSETYMMAILQMQICCSATWILRDFRIIFWLCLLPSMLISLYVDAYPSKYRPRFSIRFSFGMCLIVVAWNTMLAFDWAGSVHNQSWEWHGHRGTTMTSTFNASFTVLFFYAKYIQTGIFRPQSFAVIISEVRTAHMPHSCVCTCGNTLLPDAIFCQVCGSKRIGDEYDGEKCVCGSPLMPSANFCRMCGADIRERTKTSL